MKVYCVYKVIFIGGKVANQFVGKFYYEADALKCCRLIVDTLPSKVYYTEEEE